ncbi:MAG: TrkA family potassium uptake protein, partial [Oscillospiraceae bacterium]|nr:TrkA family potassium uptake protein [Oscillospiraceae bacterium]
MTTVLIIGVGEFGSNVARRMSELDCEVMAIDTDEERINAILPYVTEAQIGDGTNEEFLKSLGVDNYDVCIVALGGLFQSSLEATSLLKELGASMVISRATNDVQMKFLRRNGADEVVYPEKQMAIRIATKYASTSILDFIQLDNNYSIYEMVVPKTWFGKSVAQIDVRKKFDINILTLKRGDSVFLPRPDTVFES